MKPQRHGELSSYQFALLQGERGLRHGIFTRHGGVSPAPWQSLNLSTSTGDSAANVAENHRRLVTALGFEPRQLISSRQVHGSTVRRVGRAERGSHLPDCDGLISDTPGVVLLQRHADCPPIFLYDPQRRVFGVAHSGWRGTLSNIAGEMVQALAQTYGSNPAALLAGIGPSIGACCYHVGNEVTRSFVERYAHGHHWIAPGADGRVYLNLSEAIRAQLWEAGVRQIEVAELCTACNVGDFYSARAEHRMNGCFGAVIALER